MAERLDRLLDQEPFGRALWGVVIADARGRLLYERNGDRLFVPASNTKLVVAAVASALLPREYRWRTSVYAAGRVDSGVVRGDLVLYGRGDPTISDRYFQSSFTVFDELADSLRARGIVRVAGDLVGDASYFDSVVVHPSWEVYDLNFEDAAPVTALAFNENVEGFGITPGSPGGPPAITIAPDLGFLRLTNRARTVPMDSGRTLDFVRQPGTNDVWADGDVPVDARPWGERFAVVDGPGYAATAFRRSLQSRGITVSGRTRSLYDSTAYAAARRGEPLVEHLSPPLQEVLRTILEKSQNWHAEMLLKTLGRELRGQGSWPAGIEVERRFLIDSLRVDSTLFNLADGSGLSHHDLIAPRALVALLAAMHRPARAERVRAFLTALPVGGRTGTLRNRFRGSLEGRVHAKTGSIANVNSLTGYLDLAEEVWIFSIQLNNHAARSREALERIDSIVSALLHR